MEQIGIAIFGVLAIWLSQHQNTEFRRYACIFGLIAQPFWFYTAYTHQQWGVFGLCFLYTYAWLTGFYNNWMPKLNGGRS